MGWHGELITNGELYKALYRKQLGSFTHFTFHSGGKPSKTF